MYDYSALEAKFSGFDACFFCLGVSSAGMKEAEYEHVTYDLTLAAAETLARVSPQVTFIYVSGAGTDSTEQGSSMWARVKGKTENALLRLPIKAAYMFRPGFIQPLHGVRSKTRSYRLFYTLIKPLTPVLRSIFPDHILTSEQIGRAMLAVTKHGAAKPVLESRDIRSALS
jgi:uncharacterized protein YbjT (DUF2867 family)